MVTLAFIMGMGAVLADFKIALDKNGVWNPSPIAKHLFNIPKVYAWPELP